MKPIWRCALAGAAITTLSVATFLVGKAYADGIPAAAALTYSGRLERPDGTALTGSRNVEIALWNTSMGGDAPACETEATSVELVAGRFSVPLSDACQTAVRANADLWIEVSLDQASLGRSKLGAVPYALEAARASSASALQEVPVAVAAPIEGQVLRFSAGAWTPADEVIDSPQQVVEKFNAAVSSGASVTLGAIAPASGAYDLRWMVMHGSAAAACAASSAESQGSNGQLTLPKPSGTTCTQTCARFGGGFSTCLTSIAVGSLISNQATEYALPVGYNYKYNCENDQGVYDEVLGQGLVDGFYAAYCCCYG